MARTSPVVILLIGIAGAAPGGGAIPLHSPSGLEELFSAVPFVPENLNYTLALETDDDDWGLLGGFLWRVADRWRIGGFFREGPELKSATRFTAGAACGFDLPDLPCRGRLRLEAAPFFGAGGSDLKCSGAAS